MSATREPEIPVCPCANPPSTHRMSEHWVKAEPMKGPLTFARDDSPAMTAPEPTLTAEHIDAVARAVCASEFATGFGASEWDEPITNRDWYRDNARAILTSTDAAVHAAMLDALVRAGVLTVDLRTLDDGWAGQSVDREGRVTSSGRSNTVQGRLVTEFGSVSIGKPEEVAP